MPTTTSYPEDLPFGNEPPIAEPPVALGATVCSGGDPAQTPKAAKENDCATDVAGGGAVWAGVGGAGAGGGGGGVGAGSRRSAPAGVRVLVGCSCWRRETGKRCDRLLDCASKPAIVAARLVVMLTAAAAVSSTGTKSKTTQ